ncbi:hypothetical protein FRC11_003929 [Ceratobasidium sp. 423]|nr:hypothetical protein FRC11_003929 [Ceratobasidium sp. 423]
MAQSDARVSTLIRAVGAGELSPYPEFPTREDRGQQRTAFNNRASLQPRGRSADQRERIRKSAWVVASPPPRPQLCSDAATPLTPIQRSPTYDQVQAGRRRMHLRMEDRQWLGDNTQQKRISVLDNRPNTKAVIAHVRRIPRRSPTYPLSSVSR